jgi:hypothetical protein
MTRIIVSAFFGGLLALAALVSQASAASQTFNNPMQGPNRLDWCYNWGVGCGQQAANAWCVASGFQSATNFGIANDIGASAPTRLIGTGAVCDQGFCDGFAYITCYRPDPTVTYNSPVYNGNPPDWCVNWGVECGKGAADRYCQWRGHTVATGFAIANDIGGATPTRLIGTGAVCDQGFCDGFAYITCQN